MIISILQYALANDWWYISAPYLNQTSIISRNLVCNGTVDHSGVVEVPFALLALCQQHLKKKSIFKET